MDIEAGTAQSVCCKYVTFLEIILTLGGKEKERICPILVSVKQPFSHQVFYGNRLLDFDRAV